MATVWAPYDGAGTGRWTDKAYVTGWSHTMLFDSLTDLSGQMKTRGVQGKVTRVGSSRTATNPVSFSSTAR